MSYEIVLSSAFKKELKTIKKRSKDLKKLTKIVNQLANNEKLDVKNKDHALEDSVRFINCRECHIEPDWLLVYRKNDNDRVLYLIETGSHSDLF